ncbi:MAG: HD domain-containing protein [Leptospiraceae bacterium]|nr:HD domain-containing protein [Leptospiraceae bacterium]
MQLSERYDDALSYAAGLHREQERKGSGVPYISHLLSVSALVLEHGGTEDQAIAGLLHDAAEDQGGEATLEQIRVRFGDAVANIVSDCTDSWTEPKPAWRQRKTDYLASLATKPAESLLVSLADKTHNARAILMDRHQVGEAIWKRFTGGKEGSLWYYQSLAAIFERQMPGALSQELQRIVQQLAD